jgi:manganese oxidase
MAIEHKNLEVRTESTQTTPAKEVYVESVQPEMPPVQPPFSPRTRRVAGELLSPLGILFIAILIMVTIVSFSIGLGLNTAKSSSASSSSSASGSSMPGMDMSGSTSNDSAIPPATVNQGGQAATYAIDKDGAKHFDFTAKEVMWTPVTGGQPQKAFTINGMVPAPAIRVTAGDHIRVTLHNTMSEGTAIHWHGLEVPEPQDGVVGLGMTKPIGPNETYTYDFTVHDQDVGTHWYHSHYMDNSQVPGGLYGAFIVDPRPGSTQAQQAIHADLEYTEIISEMGPYYVINGKSFPDTQPIKLKHGQTVLVRLIGAGETIHPMHLHGQPFQIVAEDGHLLSSPIEKDTIQLAPGETYDLIIHGTEAPGSIYPFHCHILAHLMNPGQTEAQMGGLITLVEYDK